MSRPTLLSIDWDFFTYNGEFDKIITPKFPEGVPGALVFDWGHSEGWHAGVGSFMWISRWSDLVQHGLVPDEVVKVMPPGIKGFVDKLAPMCSFDEYLLGDSHAWGGQAILDAYHENGEQPIDVINFDAHHDLGYGELDRRFAEGTVDCSNWLLWGMARGYVEQATIVYPDWRGTQEWPPDNPIAKKLAELGRITATTWSEWQPGETTFDSGLLVRSSAWTPPWLDEEFERLSELLGGSYCLDCYGEAEIGAYDACQPREWDQEAAEDMGKHVAALMAKVNAEGERI